MALRAKAGGAPKEVLDVNDDDDELLIIVMMMIAYATKATMVILL